MKLRVALLVLIVGSSTALADSKAWTTGKSVLPASAKIVGGMSAASVRNSGLYQQALPLLMSQAGDAKLALDAIQTACNLDLLASIDSIVLGLDNAGAGTFVVALKGTNHKALDACAQKVGKAQGKTITITTDGKLTKYDGMGDKAIWLAWLANDVFAMTTSPDDKDASLKLIGGGVTGVKSIKTALGNVNKSASLWFVVDKEVPLTDLGGTMTQMYGTAKVANKKIDLDGHVVTSDAKAASLIASGANKKIADAAASGNQTLKTALASVVVTAKGNEVVSTASISEDDVLPLAMNLMR
ncbi:MAG: hypothetical protein ABI678_01055 [Kofleriaceae bacterium]